MHNEIKIAEVTYKQMEKLINRGNFTLKDDNEHFVGFHYFGYFFQSNHSFVIAYIDKKENIVGVIKWGLYNSHYGINYIDVREDMKHRGIGTLLIKYLNKMTFKPSGNINGDLYMSWYSDECIDKGFDKVIETLLDNQNVCYNYNYFRLKGVKYDIDRITPL